ncbi:glucose-inhibited division protein B [Billgrantia montanilacus]|uniref:Glucose-inhibited division protein B n=1 Tax=Billgrantia montanilacus TaxID=2282305 RepID=A0A368TRZ2_9GAMM|nr:glucose-inhibited division protein B [Halomonas montanilacus]
MESEGRIGLAVGACLLFLAACSGEDSVAEVTLAVLASNPASHDGATVATEGVVRHFEEPLHYWIEDQDLNRVEIFPHEEIAPHLGERVRVVGHFEYSAMEGRRLTLEHVEPLSVPE